MIIIHSMTVSNKPKGTSITATVMCQLLRITQVRQITGQTLSWTVVRKTEEQRCPFHSRPPLSPMSGPFERISESSHQKVSCVPQFLSMSVTSLMKSQWFRSVKKKGGVPS